MPVSLHALVSDERFGTLTPEQQREIAGKADPRVAALPPEQQDAFLAKLRTADPFDLSERRYGLPKGILRAIQATETGGQPDPSRAVSPTGVRGLMQITRGTGKKFGLTEGNWSNPVLQIDIAGQIMKENLARSKGDIKRAVAMYGDPEQADYADRVLGHWASWRGREEAGAAGPVPAPTREVLRLGGGQAVGVRPGTPQLREAPTDPAATAGRVAAEALPTVGSLVGQAAVTATLGPGAGFIGRAVLETAAGIFGGLIGRGARHAARREPVVPTKREVAEETVSNALGVLPGRFLYGTVAMTKAEQKTLLGSVEPRLAREVDPERVGTGMMRVADEAVSSVEEEEARRYGRARLVARSKDLRGPTPRDLATPARTALRDLESMGLTPSQHSTVSKLLKRVIHEVEGDVETLPNGEIIVRHAPKETLSYAEADDLRRELQPYVTQFESRGRPTRPTQNALDETYRNLKRYIRGLARGTEVDNLLADADDYFIHHVKPTRAARNAVARGQTEPRNLVDVLFTKKHENKLAKLVAYAEKKDPEFLQRLRAAKFQNMVERATHSGSFNPREFETAWKSMPRRTQMLLSTHPDEIGQFLTNLERARLKGERLARVTRGAVGALSATEFALGLNDVYNGNVEKGLWRIVGSPVAGYFLARHLSSDMGLRWMNRALRSAALGASPNRVMRYSSRAIAHLGLDVIDSELRSLKERESASEEAQP